MLYVCWLVYWSVVWQTMNCSVCWFGLLVCSMSSMADYNSLCFGSLVQVFYLLYIYIFLIFFLTSTIVLLISMTFSFHIV